MSDPVGHAPASGEGPDPRRILALSRKDRSAALRELGGLTLEGQAALVCEAPVEARAELLELLPFPEHVIPLLPEAELCFTVRAVGLADASWLLEHATSEQIVASIDLDAWGADAPDRGALDEWIAGLAAAGEATLLRAVHAMDAELIVHYLKAHIFVVLKPSDSDGGQDWQVPEGAQTLDGQFYFGARAADDDLAPIQELLRVLFTQDYWRYFRMLQGTVWEIDSDNDEWALRWRSGRLEDLGFPVWDRAISIYRYLPPAQRATIPPDTSPLRVGEWHLPVWIPELPATRDPRHTIFRAVAELEPEERRSAFYAFVGLANKVAVADRMPLSDASFTARAIDKAARFVSLGLEHVAGENGLSLVEAVRRISFERLFVVGANLDPESARPVPLAPEADSDADGPPPS